MRPFKKGFITKCASYGIDKEAAKELFEKIALGMAGGAVANTSTPAAPMAMSPKPVMQPKPQVMQPKPQAMQPKPPVVRR